MTSVPCLPVAAHTALALVASGWLDTVLFSLPLLSGATLLFRGDDLLLVVSLFLLGIEISRATSSSSAAILESCAVAAGVHHRPDRFHRHAATGQHYFLPDSADDLIDVIAGFTVTITAARRNVSYDE